MNKGMKYLIVAALAAGATVSSYANVTVNAGANSFTYLTDMSGTYLDSDLVEVGTFASTPTDGTASMAGFNVFMSGLTGSGGNAGALTLSANASELGFAPHSQIYVAVFDGATTAASQHALFYVNKANDTSWTFPVTSDIPNITTFDIEQLIQNPGAASPALVTGGHVVYGALGFDGTYTEIQTIPEPSSLMLVGLGLLGAVGLMRRHRS